jgi:hypothetical protein
VAHAVAAAPTARAVMGPFSTGEGAASTLEAADARTAAKRPFMLSEL